MWYTIIIYNAFCYKYNSKSFADAQCQGHAESGYAYNLCGRCCVLIYTADEIQQGKFNLGGYLREFGIRQTHYYSSQCCQ